MESMDLKAIKCFTAGNDTLKLLGSRGTMEILCLFCCSQRRVRFTELGNLFTHISTKTLASRLKELEKNGLLTRTAYNEIPPRVEYSMTEKGQSLVQALTPLVRWMTNEKQSTE
jgi:DNA-binding HxlR family transcriptional regulator